MLIPATVFHASDVYGTIRERFWKRSRIDITQHIQSITYLGQRLEQGINFIPVDARKWEAALRAANYREDERFYADGTVSPAGTAAAAATIGKGFRERGWPSLHCAVAKSVCRVHLDRLGFSAETYGPDAFPHILDELAWQAKILPFLSNYLPKGAMEVLYRIHPVLPNLRQFRPYSQVGVEVDLFTGQSRDAQRQLRITFDVTHTCKDGLCGELRNLSGWKDYAAGITLRVTGW